MNSFITYIFDFFRRLVPFITVSPWEQAVRVRAGKHVTLLQPGIHLRLPYVDFTITQSVRLRVSSLGRQVLTDKTGRTITINSTIGYQIVNILELFQTLHHAEATVQNIAQASLASFVSGNVIGEAQHQDIENYVRSQLKLNRYGLGNVDFHITELSYCKTYRLIGDYAPMAFTDSLNTSVRDQMQVNGPR